MSHKKGEPKKQPMHCSFDASHILKDLKHLEHQNHLRIIKDI